MEENKQELQTMPTFQHESDMQRLMKIIKWLVGIVVLLIVLLVGSNVAWIVYESQFEDIVTHTQTITQELSAEGDGDAIINDGVHINGESETDSD